MAGLFKRLFGGKPPPPPSPPPPTQVKWSPPVMAYIDRFTLHFYKMPLVEVEAAVTAAYLPLALPGPAMVLAQQGAWATAYVAPTLAQRAGFNKQAGQIAAQQDTWVIGYRIYQETGLDAHFFEGETHVAGLALSEEVLEWEPEDPLLFAAVADVTAVTPRPLRQHPLDYHFALLACLGVQDAALTWDEALARHAAGTLGTTKLLNKE
jgi:hypothetical protein